MKKGLYTKLSLMILCILPTIAYASFTITPVKIKITKDEKITSLTLKNNSELLKHFQLLIFRVENENGKEDNRGTNRCLI